MMMGYGRNTLMAASAVVCLAIATPAVAQTKSFNVPAQAAQSAIGALGRQADVQIIAARRDTKGRRTNEVRGDMTVEQALSRMLEGTGLAVRRTGPQTFTVIAPPPSVPKVTPARGEAKASPVSGEANAGSAAADSESAEIIVTGSNIRGNNPVTAPAIVSSRDQIERSGYTTAEQYIERLPQNLGDFSSLPGKTGVPEAATSDVDRTSGINLRGLGANATLVLVNGIRRPGGSFGRSTDISAIPLAAIERIEIATGGHSSIYGSDAVAGVVNVITRTSFDGARADISYELGKQGRYQSIASGVVGREDQSAGILVSYTHRQTSPFDLVRLGLTRPVGAIAFGEARYGLENRESIYAAGHFDPLPGLELAADGYYDESKSNTLTSIILTATGATLQSTGSPNDKKQYGGAARFKFDVDRWQVRGAGSYTHFSSYARTINRLNGAITGNPYNNAGEIKSGSLVAEGPISLAGIDVRAALGGEIRREEVDVTRVVFRRGGGSRTVKSLFGELYVPIGEKRHGDPTLAVNLSGRYDRYSDFGSTTNGSAGIAWRPFEPLRLKASYATSFRAPALYELTAANDVQIQRGADTSVPGGIRPLLVLIGGNPDLQPETARSWELGFDLLPLKDDRLRIGMSYFGIRYKNRIDVAAPSTAVAIQALNNEVLYPGLINRAPTNAFLNAAVAGALSDGGSVFNSSGTPFNSATQTLLAVFPTIAVFDNRYNNIAVDRVEGLDATVALRQPLRDGTLIAEIAGTKYFSKTRQITVSSPSFSQLNSVGLPVDFRFRSQLGFENEAFGVRLSGNYIASYPDQRPGANYRIPAFVTFDLNLRLDIGAMSKARALSNLVLSAGVTNLFDRAAPALRLGTDLTNFDGVNATPFGRTFVFRLSKSW